MSASDHNIICKYLPLHVPPEFAHENISLYKENGLCASPRKCRSWLKSHCCRDLPSCSETHPCPSRYNRIMPSWKMFSSKKTSKWYCPALATSRETEIRVSSMGPLLIGKDSTRSKCPPPVLRYTLILSTRAQVDMAKT